jgi:small-conductance mechanosensitive channel
MNAHMKTLVSRIWVPALWFLAFVIALTIGDGAVNELARDLPAPVGGYVPYAVHIGAWLSAAFLVNRVVDAAIWELLVARGTSIKVPKLLRQLSALIVYIGALIGITGFVFAQSVTALVTTSSAVGLLIGFAVRSLILDAFSGIAINLEQPFRIGNFIQIRGRGPEPIMGLVQEVNWRTTRLLTLENDIIVIPNGMLAESVILNRSAPNTTCWFEHNITLDFAVPPERALRVLTSATDMTVASGSAMAQPEPKIFINNIDENGVHYRINYAIDPTKQSPRRAKHALLRHVLDSLRHAGLSPAVSSQDLFIGRQPERLLDFDNLAHRAALLRRVALFAEFDQAALDLLARQAQVRMVAARAIRCSSSSRARLACACAARMASSARSAICSPALFSAKCRRSPAPSDRQPCTPSARRCSTKLPRSTSPACSIPIPALPGSCRGPSPNGKCATRPRRRSCPPRRAANSRKTWSSR